MSLVLMAAAWVALPGAAGAPLLPDVPFQPRFSPLFRYRTQTIRQQVGDRLVGAAVGDRPGLLAGLPAAFQPLRVGLGAYDGLRPTGFRARFGGGFPSSVGSRFSLGAGLLSGRSTTGLAVGLPTPGPQATAAFGNPGVGQSSRRSRMMSGLPALK